MNKYFPALVLLLIGSLSLSACALPPEPDAVVSKRAERPLDGQELNQYLNAARNADNEQDLLKRCLQFPDLPGTKWSQKHVLAHCNFHFGHLNLLGKIEELISKRDFSAIEAHLSQANAAHEKDKNESIHTLIYALSERNDILELTKSWLEANPKSVFAHTLQAEAYLSAAGNARGYMSASETSEEQFSQMSRHLVDAKRTAEIALSMSSESAITWLALAKISKLGSDDQLHARVMARAFEKDEDCAEFARFIMDALLPRWGGSYEEMQNYAENLKSKVALNPLLLLPLYAADVDAASIRTGDVQQFNHAKDRLRAVIAESSNEVAMLGLAERVMTTKLVDEGWGWEHGVLVLQHTRFHGIKRDDAFSIFQQIASFDPKWAIQYGVMGGTEVDGKVRSDITDSTYYQPMAEIYSRAGATEEAEIFMLKLRENITADLRLMDSDEKLMDLWLAADEKKFPNKAEKAKKYAEEIVKRNSHHHFAWVAFNRYLTQVPNADVDIYLLESFKKNVDQSMAKDNPEFAEINKRLK